MRASLWLTGFMVLLVTASLANAEVFQASLTPDVAIHDQTARIDGVCLSIWGENPQKALSIGFVNGSTAYSSGLTLGLFNYAENYSGVQFAFLVNTCSGDFVGWQGSMVNYAGGSFKGLQSGAVNITTDLNGVQLGMVNFAETTTDFGLQLGFVNLIPENERWFAGLPNELAPGMIFVNWRF